MPAAGEKNLGGASDPPTSRIGTQNIPTSVSALIQESDRVSAGDIILLVFGFLLCSLTFETILP